MNSIVLFAIVLAVAGGFIAWLGDWLGTKVGKKRMTFWKLRPRHTAMLYTIVSGGLISLLTLMVLIVSNYSFKKALLEGPRLVLQNEEFRQQIQDQKAKARASESQFVEAQRKLAPVQGQLVQNKQELDKTKIALSTIKQQLGDARQKVGVAQGQAQAEQGKVLAAQRQVADVERQVRDLQTKRRQLLARNGDLKDMNLALSYTFASSSLGELIYKQNDEVGRAVISTRQPVRKIRDEMTQLLRDLGRDAAPRVGTKPEQAVALALVPGLRAEALSVLSRNIAEQADRISSVVIVARASRNTFHGEPVLVALKPYDNTWIYRKGAIVATQSIDGTQSEAQILSALQTFFTNRVRASALQHGLIPLNDPQTHTLLFGAVNGAKSLDLTKQIQQIGASAQVTAYALVNTYSSGPVPMQLDFTVTPGAPSQSRPGPALSSPGGSHP